MTLYRRSSRRGPWPTLVPAGDGQFSATYAICTVGAKEAEPSQLDIAIEVMRNASAIVNEPRSFADAYGGLAAYEALVSDLKEPEADISRVILWSAKPRAQLIASRELAAAFLREVAPSLPEAARESVESAATLYEQVVIVLRDEWPLPEEGRLHASRTLAQQVDVPLDLPHLPYGESRLAEARVDAAEEAPVPAAASGHPHEQAAPLAGRPDDEGLGLHDRRLSYRQ